MGFSIVHYYGPTNSKCGYCKGTESSNCHGMHAYTMLPEDYQDLIDRGWRRSGQYCYKPSNENTCCPCYTIKCDAVNFKLTKSHKKILRRMQRFLRDGKRDSLKAPNNEEESVDKHNDVVLDEPQAPNIILPEVNIDELNFNKHLVRNVKNINAVNVEIVSSDNCGVKLPTPVISTKPPCKKAKQMRLERRNAKIAEKGVTSKPKTITNREKQLRDYFLQTDDQDKHKLKIVLVDSSLNTHVTDEVYNLYRKYQLQIHNDNPERLNPTRLQRFLYKTPLKHSDPVNGPSDGYGSFHQQYWLDDILIAVGVIDVLPNCVSSVYFFYDPDYSFLSLGTYASLQEIHLVQQLSAKIPELKYYYMGFYIHSCPKMRYKGKLVPSYLLCPETYSWHMLTDDIRTKLDSKKYQRLHEDANAKDSNEFTNDHLDGVLLLIDSGTYTTYKRYIKIPGDDDIRQSVLVYGRLVGKACAHRMLYVQMK